MNEEDKKVPAERLGAPLSESIFKAEDEWLELNKPGRQQSIRRAKNTLFVIGSLMLLVPIIAWLRFEELPALYAIVYIVAVSGLFIGLGILANRSKPYTAIMTGLIAFIVYLAGNIVLRGINEGIGGAFNTLISGILFKGIAIYLLAKALPDAQQMQLYYKRTLIR